MTSVWYVGRSSTRILTIEEWGGLGATAEHDTVWNWANGYSVPYSELTSRQLDVLAELDGFLPGQPDGPREYPLPPPNTQAGESQYFRAMRKLYRGSEALVFDQQAEIDDLKKQVRRLRDTYDDELDGDDVVTVARSLATTYQVLVAGDLYVSYFTAREEGLRSKIKVVSGSIAAGATPTVMRLALYRIEANGNATLLATTAHDPALLSTVTTEYTKDLSVPVEFVEGQRYAWCPLIASTGAMPNLVSANPTRYQLGNLMPRLTARVTGPFTDFPPVITAGQLPGATIGRIWARFTT